MKRIDFDEVYMENFCSHIEPVTVSFKRNEITLITGPNGSGKTTIFQAIPFTLFGICSKGRAGDVLNEKTQKNCHTYVIFHIDDNKYKVDRYVKYTKLGNTATITRNDEDKPYKTGDREVVAEIERLLMPYDLFTNILLFNQQTKSFFTNLNDSAQKDIFRKILVLQDYVYAFQLAGKKVSEIELKILGFETDKVVNQNLLLETQNQIEKWKTIKIEFENQKKISVKQIEDEIINMKKEIQKLEAEILSLNKPEIQKSKDLLTANITHFKKEIDELEISKKKEIDHEYINAEAKKTNLEKTELEKEKAVKDRRDELLAQIEEKYAQLIQTHNQNKKQNDQYIKELNHLTTSWFNNHQILLQSKTEKEKEILDKVEKEFSLKLEPLNKQIESLRTDRTVFNNIEESYKNLIDPINEEILKNKSELQKTKNEIEMISIKIQSLKDQLKLYDIDTSMEVCPTCLQEVGEQAIQNIHNIQNKISASIEEEDNHQKELQSLPIERQKVIDELELKVTDLLKQKTESIKAKTLEIEEEISKINSDIQRNKDLNVIEKNNAIQMNSDSFKPEIDKSLKEKEELDLKLKGFESDQMKLDEQYDSIMTSQTNEKKEIIEQSSAKLQDFQSKLASLKSEIDIECEKNIVTINSNYQVKEQQLNESIEQTEKQTMIYTIKIEAIEIKENDLIVLKTNLDNKTNDLEVEGKKSFDESFLINHTNREEGYKKAIESIDANIENERNMILAYEFWREGFSSSGIQSLLIDESIPILNSEVGKYLDYVSNGRYIVSFDTMKATKSGELRDKISVNIFDKITHAKSKIQISGGQERLIDIATILTLGDLQKKIQNVDFNILIFDEVFDSLDDQNIENVCNLMKVIKKDKSVCIISHENVEQLEANNNLSFR